MLTALFIDYGSDFTNKISCFQIERFVYKLDKLLKSNIIIDKVFFHRVTSIAILYTEFNNLINFINFGSRFAFIICK